MISAVLPKLLAGGVALGLAVAAASKASAAEPDMPPAMVQAMVEAIASRDAGVMRAVAAKLDQLGYALPAADLRKTADEIEAENQMRRTTARVMPQTAAQQPRQQPQRPAQQPRQQPQRPAQRLAPKPIQPATVAPGTPASPKQVLASKVALNLQTTVPGRENRKLMAEFQANEGLEADGVYGPKTAVAFIKYGIVPATPRAWPKGSNGPQARAAYAALLESQAKADPTRAEEWLRAASAAKVAPNSKKVPLPKAADYAGVGVDPDELARRMAAAAGYQTDPGALGIGL